MDLITKQSAEPVFLTNGCLENAWGSPALLEAFGLSYGAWPGSGPIVDDREAGEFYPLTAAEALFVAEEMVETRSGFGARMMYTALYQGRKWSAPTIEYYAGDEPTDGDMDRVRAMMYEEGARIEPAITAAGGMLKYEEDSLDDRHTLTILFPLDEVQARFGTYEAYCAWLADVLR